MIDEPAPPDDKPLWEYRRLTVDQVNRLPDHVPPSIRKTAGQYPHVLKDWLSPKPPPPAPPEASPAAPVNPSPPPPASSPCPERQLYWKLNDQYLRRNPWRDPEPEYECHTIPWPKPRNPWDPS